MTKAMTKETTEEIIEKISPNKDIMKGQEVNLTFNLIKTETKVTKEEAMTKITVNNSKKKIITSKKFSLNLKISKTMCMLAKNQISISFMIKSNQSFPNTILLESKQQEVRSLRLFNWLKIFRKIFQISKESTFLELSK